MPISEVISDKHSRVMSPRRVQPQRSTYSACCMNTIISAFDSDALMPNINYCPTTTRIIILHATIIWAIIERVRRSRQQQRPHRVTCWRHYTESHVRARYAVTSGIYGRGPRRRLRDRCKGSFGQRDFNNTVYGILAE